MLKSRANRFDRSFACAQHTVLRHSCCSVRSSCMGASAAKTSADEAFSVRGQVRSKHQLHANASLEAEDTTLEASTLLSTVIAPIDSNFEPTKLRLP
eukprot:6183492-Pleurochrysis_carterae.AAC.1